MEDDLKLNIVNGYLEEMEYKKLISGGQLISAYPSPDEMHAVIGMIRDIYVTLKTSIDTDKILKDAVANINDIQVINGVPMYCFYNKGKIIRVTVTGNETYDEIKEMLIEDGVLTME